MLPNITESFQDVCRLCLFKAETLRSIFDLTLNNPNDLVLVDKILKCLNIEIKEEDIISKQICEICLENVEKFYEFRNKANDAQEVLNKLVNNIEYLSNAAVQKETQELIENVINYNDVKSMPLEVDDLDNEIENCFLEELDAQNTNCKDPLALDEYQIATQKPPNDTNFNSILKNNQPLVITQNTALQSPKTQPQLLILIRKDNNEINQAIPQQINVIKPQNLISSTNNPIAKPQQINTIKPQNLIANFSNQPNVNNLTIQSQQIKVITPLQINNIKPQINLSNLQNVQNIGYLTTPSPTNIIKPQSSLNNLQNFPSITNLKPQTHEIKLLIKPQNLITNYNNAQNIANKSNITSQSQIISVIKPQSDSNKIQNVANFSNLKAAIHQTNNVIKVPIIDNTCNFQNVSNISNPSIASNRQSISDSKKIINNSVSNTHPLNIKPKKQENSMKPSYRKNLQLSHQVKRRRTE